ncbi:hypothetical protein CBR_g2911 [Chara braunii]|uniref:DUF659 domain-containing protein n=1 Tax=Chara braunii TaxID=69332 RepID=A0A388KE86_CHABU|nr:hypothetical protein CBR_g2911 [Chara braunii]|eukprot:GBG68368.1 hypothetical protein CBR_g2911 [Chara braunii]
MSTHASEGVKKHFLDLGPNGPIVKGNKNRQCKYCERPVAGTASRFRDHFLLNRCKLGSLRARLTKEELQERERGKNVAIAEVGGVVKPADAHSEHDDCEASEAEAREMPPRSVVGASRSRTGTKQSLITDSAIVVTKNAETQQTIDDWMTAHCIPVNMMKSEEWDNMVKALMNANESFKYAEIREGEDHSCGGHEGEGCSKGGGTAVAKVLETSKGLLSLLKFVDGDRPTIGKIYDRIGTLVENLRESKTFTEVEKDELETIIMRRWNVMTSPLHCGAMFLDPEYKASKPEQDLEVANGFWMWVYGWCKPAMYKEVDDEVNNWIDGVGKFRSKKAMQQARGMQPARLETVKPSTLVYRRWNQHLLKKLTKKPKTGEDELLWEEDLDLEKEVQAHADMRVEWRSRLREENRRRECDDESEDDGEEEDDDDVADVVEVEENNGGEGQMVRTRIQGSLLELERELNDSWRKSTKASKYLARLHLGDCLGLDGWMSGFGSG